MKIKAKKTVAKKVQKGEVVVISVGGSPICPDEIDLMFLSAFRDLVLKEVRNGKRFVIITGGGKVARRYQDAIKSLGFGNDSDSDWAGIEATRINARLVKSLFGSHAEDFIIQTPKDKFSFKKSIVIGGGWKPGFSSDFDAVLLAKRFRAKRMVNLSNIDYIYTADPRLDVNAEKIEQIKWKEFRKLIPKKWTPGLSSPFDPVASREAESIKLQVAIINGKKLAELDKFLRNEPFVGSLIKS